MSSFESNLLKSTFSSPKNNRESLDQFYHSVNSIDTADLLKKMRIRLKKSESFSGSLKIKCPFHRVQKFVFKTGKEQTASMGSHTGIGFHCFGCGETLSVFSFVQKYYGWDKIKTTRWFCKNFDIPFP